MKHRYEATEITRDVQRVMAFAAELGLHGIMILSPVCRDCGALHQWNMLTDLMTSANGDDTVVHELLLYHAERLDNQAPVDLGEVKRPDA